MMEHEAAILPRKDHANWRFRKGFELVGKWYKSVTVEGAEHLNLPPEVPVVFAVDHTSDASIPLAASVLASKFDVGIGFISALMDHPKMKWIFGSERLLLGWKKFFPIDFSIEGKGWKPEKFNEKNFEPMVHAMKHKGMAMIMAAHNPHYDLTLPDRGGLGAVWLAQKANAIVVPVVVDLHVPPGDKAGAIETLVKHPLARKSVTVKFGAPMQLGKINLNPTTEEEKKHMKTQLRSQSNTIMETLATLLPVEKQGRWKKTAHLAK